MANLEALNAVVAKIQATEAAAVVKIQALEAQVADLQAQLTAANTDQAGVDNATAALTAAEQALAAVTG